MSGKGLVGIDTPFLLAHTLLEHADHARARAWQAALLQEGCGFALCPTVAEEFVHVATDPRRFERPVAMPVAMGIIRAWLRAREVVALLPSEESWRLQLDWLEQHRLGRKRIHDAGIAAIYHCHEVSRLLTRDSRDFGVFGCFEVIDIGAAPGNAR